MYHKSSITIFIGTGNKKEIIIHIRSKVDESECISWRFYNSAIIVPESQVHISKTEPKTIFLFHMATVQYSTVDPVYLCRSNKTIQDNGNIYFDVQHRNDYPHCLNNNINNKKHDSNNNNYRDGNSKNNDNDKSNSNSSSNNRKKHSADTSVVPTEITKRNGVTCEEVILSPSRALFEKQPLVLHRPHMNRKERSKRCASVGAFLTEPLGADSIPKVDLGVSMYELVNDGWIYDNLSGSSCKSTLNLDAEINDIIKINSAAEICLGDIKVIF